MRSIAEAAAIAESVLFESEWQRGQCLVAATQFQFRYLTLDAILLVEYLPQHDGRITNT